MTDEQEAVISAVHHQLAHGEASEGDLKDIRWCAEQLRELLGAPPPFHKPPRKNEPARA